MDFIPRLNDSGMSGSMWWYSSGNPFYDTPNHMYGLPNCTCYAYGRYAEIRHQLRQQGFALLPTGNAKEWYNSATSFERGQTPKLGAVVCYGPAPDNNYAGHVAIVEAINQDGSLVTSNSYYNGQYFATETVYAVNNYTPIWALNKGYVLQGFIYNDAVSSGYSDYVLAAIFGNWTYESAMNPGAWEGYVTDGAYNQIGVGFGLGQWTNVSQYGRLWNLHMYAFNNNLPENDGAMQLNFFLAENYWTALGSSYNNLNDFLVSNSTDISALTEEFLLHWEGIGTQTLNDRINFANDAYSYIQLHKADSPDLYQWISGNRPLTTSEKNNNIMCAYFQLSSPTSGPPHKPKKKTMPLWMYLKYGI